MSVQTSSVLFRLEFQRYRVPPPSIVSLSNTISVNVYLLEKPHNLNTTANIDQYTCSHAKLD